MSEVLNLQAMKNSRKRKHNKIYEKAIRMMEKGWKTKEMSESEIMEMARKQFPQLDVSVKIGGDIIVRSKKDTWLIKDEGTYLTLYHRGMAIIKGKPREQYHIQDIFYDLEFVFASIVSHDEYALGIRSRNVKEIKDMIIKSRESDTANR